MPRFLVPNCQPSVVSKTARGGEKPCHGAELGPKDRLGKNFFKDKIVALKQKKPPPCKPPAKRQTEEKPNKIKGFRAVALVPIVCRAVLVSRKKVKNFYFWG